MGLGCFLCLFRFLLLFLGRFCLTGITVIHVSLPIWLLLLLFGGWMLRLHKFIPSLQSPLLCIDMRQYPIKIGLRLVNLIEVIDFLNGIDILKFGLKFEAVQVVPVSGTETTSIDVVCQSDGFSRDLFFAISAESTASGGVGCLDGLGIVGAHKGGWVCVNNTYWGCVEWRNRNSDIIIIRPPQYEGTLVGINWRDGSKWNHKEYSKKLKQWLNFNVPFLPTQTIFGSYQVYGWVLLRISLLFFDLPQATSIVLSLGCLFLAIISSVACASWYCYFLSLSFWLLGWSATL